MSFWNAILQGIIQGLTEFLPVSSSGHLSLYQHFTGQSGEAAGLFSILLHLGTLAAVCIAFWDTIWGMIVEFFRMIGDVLKGKFTFHTTDPNRRMIFMIVVALVPLLVFFFLRDWYTSLSTDNDIIVEGLCFLATAGLLYLADHGAEGWLHGRGERWTAIRDGSIVFPARPEGILSVFCVGPDAEGVTIRGAQYPLEGATLTASVPLGVSNHFIGQDIMVEVIHGSLLTGLHN